MPARKGASREPPAEPDQIEELKRLVGEREPRSSGLFKASLASVRRI
jgi:hypothetical protein